MPATRISRRLVPALATAAALLAPASAALADSGTQCTEDGAYGSSCIRITGDGLRVDDVQGYFSPPNNDYLTHRHWALELTSYRCDPVGQRPGQCKARRKWRTRVRHGNPRQDGSRCEVFTPEGVGFEQCQNYGVAYADAQLGDWRGFRPHRFRRATWLCTGLVVRVHGHWRRNGAAHSPGVRGCAQVHG